MQTKFFIREISNYDWRKLGKLCGKEKMNTLDHFAKELKKTWNKNKIEVWNFNSSASGGGVADLLDALSSLSKEYNINWTWFIINGDPDFFTATKNFHNALHANKPVKITPKTIKKYLTGTKTNVKMLHGMVNNANFQKPDIVLVHDPQPLAIFPEFKKRYPALFQKNFKDSIFIWQSHIPFKISPKSRLAKFLIKCINFYDLAVYHRNNKTPVLKIPIFNKNINSINPLCYFYINLLESKAGKEFIDATIAKHGIRRYGPKTQFILQNARFDPWKDPLGVTEAFSAAFEILKKKDKLIKLILVGPVAGDDINETAELLKNAKTVANKFNSKHRGIFIYIRPLFTRKENLTHKQWEKFLSLGLNPDKLYPRFNRFQRKALKKIRFNYKNIKQYNMHDLEINAFQSFSDIIILKSLEEGQGLSAMGAKFKGKPLIASAVGGLIDQVEDHVSGILVGLDPKTKLSASEQKEFRKLTIQQTKDAIVELVENPKLAKAIGKTGHLDALENYTTPRHLADYYKIFLEAKRLKK